jgi:hypothetical protein
MWCIPVFVLPLRCFEVSPLLNKAISSHLSCRRSMPLAGFPREPETATCQGFVRGIGIRSMTGVMAGS